MKMPGSKVASAYLTERVFYFIVSIGLIPFEVIRDGDTENYKVETRGLRTFRRLLNLAWSLGMAASVYRKAWVSLDHFIKSDWTEVPLYHYELAFVITFCYSVFGVFAWCCYWYQPELNCELINLLLQKIHQVNQSEETSGHNVLTQLSTEGGYTKLEAQIAMFRLLPYQFVYMFLVPPTLYFYDATIPMLLLQDPIIQALEGPSGPLFYACMALDTVFIVAGMSVLYYVMFITLGSIGSINFRLHDLNLMVLNGRKELAISTTSVAPSSVLSVMVKKAVKAVAKATLAPVTSAAPASAKLAPSSKIFINKIVSWRTRQLCKSLRELQLVIQYFNLGLCYVVFTMKAFAQVLTVILIFTAIIIFKTDLLIALLNLFSGLEIGYLFLGTYDPAFSIPKRIAGFKANVSQASGDYAFKVTKKKYLRIIRSMPEKGIQVGCFRELERATSPNFIQFVTSTVASLLVAF